MNCGEARLHIGAEPAALPEAVAEHVAGCAACAGLLAQALAFEGDLQRALTLAPPALRHAPVTARVTPLAAPAPAPAPVATRTGRLARWRRPTTVWALAASALLVSVLGIVLWAVRPAESLAAGVVAHMAGEPQSWSATDPAPQREVDRVLGLAGARLDPGATDVVYVQSCWFRGHFVPHLVVRTDHGPVTVMLLPAEHILMSRRIDSDGYQGTLVPFGRGSLALLGRGDAKAAMALLPRIAAAIHWLPAPRG